MQVNLITMAFPRNNPHKIYKTFFVDIIPGKKLLSLFINSLVTRYKLPMLYYKAMQYRHIKVEVVYVQGL